jgi:hypothetical protein
LGLVICFLTLPFVFNNKEADICSLFFCLAVVQSALFVPYFV